MQYVRYTQQNPLKDGLSGIEISIIHNYSKNDIHNTQRVEDTSVRFFQLCKMELSNLNITQSNNSTANVFIRPLTHSYLLTKAYTQVHTHLRTHAQT